MGRAAITFFIDISVPAEKGKLWVQYSYALCSPRCQFSRKKGREISFGRYSHHKKKHVSGFTVNESLVESVQRLVWSNFFSDVSLGESWIHRVGWLRKLAELIQKADGIQKGTWNGEVCGIDDVYRSIRRITRGDDERAEKFSRYIKDDRPTKDDPFIHLQIAM
jgi:hypothetical protein